MNNKSIINWKLLWKKIKDFFRRKGSFNTLHDDEFMTETKGDPIRKMSYKGRPIIRSKEGRVYINVGTEIEPVYKEVDRKMLEEEMRREATNIIVHGEKMRRDATNIAMHGED